MTLKNPFPRPIEDTDRVCEEPYCRHPAQFVADTAFIDYTPQPHLLCATCAPKALDDAIDL